MLWRQRSALVYALQVILAAAVLCGIYVVQMDSFGTWQVMQFFAGSCEIPDTEFQVVNFAHGAADGGRENILRDLTLLPEVRALSVPQTKWDDPALIKLLRQEVLDPPRPYLPKHSYPLFKTPQAQTVDDIFKWKANGFFVECGALDGERSSNTIWLEKKCGWTGLLVEMDPSYYMQLRGKNRRCYSANVCLSPQTSPVIANFKEHHRGSGRLLNKNNSDSAATPLSRATFCVPFYSLMLAMNRTKVDYFSLDVEGFELPILKTIPFDKLDISVFTVERIHHSDWGKKTKEKADDQVQFMASKGYEVYTTLDRNIGSIGMYAHDYVFVKKGLRV